jgi:antitoxin PrlF
LVSIADFTAVQTPARLKKLDRQVNLTHEPDLSPARCFSMVLAKGQTVIPREICKQLKLKSGETLRYRFSDDGILLDKAAQAGGDPFAAFSEWTSEVDEKAYGEL